MCVCSGRSWRATESAATTGRLPSEVRDPAALRAYTTPNICVQGGRIEFIQPLPAPERPGERPAAATVPSCGGRRERSPLRDAALRDEPPARDAWRSAATERGRRDFASLRDGDIRAVNSLKDRDIRTVSSSRDRGVHTLASVKDREIHHSVPNLKDRPRYEWSSLREKDVSGMAPLIEDDQEEPEPGPGSKGKEQKEENNQEVRNTRPATLPDRGSPVRSPTPGRKVKDKVAQFEQLGIPREGPRRDSDSSETTSAQVSRVPLPPVPNTLCLTPAVVQLQVIGPAAVACRLRLAQAAYLI